ncbi:CRISPR-associated protein Cas1 [Clostridiaceae bacterium JG1575]|nr:CRISPR-associated protein Cas1 [Clostridiaceae bacterium JG1575]
MRKLLNTLYVTKEKLFFSKDGETIRIEEEGVKIAQYPVHNFESIVFFNTTTITPQLLKMFSEHQISASFLSHTGEFLVAIQNPIHGNVRLRRAQYNLSASAQDSLGVAKNLILAKILNARQNLLRFKRDHSDKITSFSELQNTIIQMKSSADSVCKASNDQMLLGIEGDAAKAYFSVFNHLIFSPDFSFGGRSKRPPKDEVNALLSFFYVLLSHDCKAALETVGLDPQVGFYHKDRPGRYSLALDLMEEMRSYLVDRFVLTLINNRVLTPKEFIRMEDSAIILTEEAKKTALAAWQQRKQELFTHPFLDEKIELGLLPYTQALLMARFIRGDLDQYPPFFLR